MFRSRPQSGTPVAAGPTQTDSRCDQIVVDDWCHRDEVWVLRSAGCFLMVPVLAGADARRTFDQYDDDHEDRLHDRRSVLVGTHVAIGQELPSIWMDSSASAASAASRRETPLWTLRGRARGTLARNPARAWRPGPLRGTGVPSPGLGGTLP